MKIKDFSKFQKQYLCTFQTTACMHLTLCACLSSRTITYFKLGNRENFSPFHLKRKLSDTDFFDGVRLQVRLNKKQQTGSSNRSSSSSHPSTSSSTTNNLASECLTLVRRFPELQDFLQSQLVAGK